MTPLLRQSKAAPGSPAGGAPGPTARLSDARAVPATPEQPSETRAWLAADCVRLFEEVKDLLDAGALRQADTDRLKADLFGAR